MNTKTCPVEISPQCPGHQGWEKLQTCLIAAFYGSNADEVTGNVDGFERWVGLFLTKESETIDLITDRGHMIPVTVPAGTYGLLTEDSRGFVGWDTYLTEQQAQDAYDEWDRAYGAWCEAEEAREAEIMTSTGLAGVW